MFEWKYYLLIINYLVGYHKSLTALDTYLNFYGLGWPLLWTGSKLWLLNILRTNFFYFTSIFTRCHVWFMSKSFFSFYYLFIFEVYQLVIQWNTKRWSTGCFKKHEKQRFIGMFESWWYVIYSILWKLIWISTFVVFFVYLVYLIWLALSIGWSQIGWP